MCVCLTLSLCVFLLIFDYYFFTIFYYYFLIFYYKNLSNSSFGWGGWEEQEEKKAGGLARSISVRWADFVIANFCLFFLHSSPSQTVVHTHTHTITHHTHTSHHHIHTRHNTHTYIQGPVRQDEEHFLLFFLFFPFTVSMGRFHYAAKKYIPPLNKCN